MAPWIHPTNRLWVRNKNFQKHFCYNSDIKDSIKSQFCTCHDSWAVMACEKLWFNLMIIFHKRTAQSFIRFGLLDHQMFMKWMAGIVFSTSHNCVESGSYSEWSGTWTKLPFCRLSWRDKSLLQLHKKDHLFIGYFAIILRSCLFNSYLVWKCAGQDEHWYITAQKM